MTARTGRTLRRIATTLSWAYFICLGTCLLLRLLFQDRWWWLAFLNSFTPYWFLPLLPAGGLSLLTGLTKRRALLLLSLMGTAAFLALYGQLFLPNRLRGAHPDCTLTVMSYNLLGTNRDWPAVSASILEARADVVALQELNREIAAHLASEFSDRYPYQILDTQDSLISRYPVTRTPASLAGSWGSPPQVYEIDWAGQRVLLVNAHFYASLLNPDVPFMTWVLREREQQAAQVAGFVAQTGLPLLVTADLNATDQSQAYRLLRTRLADAWREAGWGLGHTFPGGAHPDLRRPVIGGQPVPRWLVRIDYVFHSADWYALQARLGQWDGVSDHRPVVVTLALRD